MKHLYAGCRQCLREQSKSSARLRRRFYATSTDDAANSLHDRPYRLAIVGSGPAGFYAASRILGLAGSRNVKIDMFEELPVPFGLVRYGVAPDHPEVKNCMHKFEEMAEDLRFRYFGNVQIGGPSASSTPSQDISFKAPSDLSRPTQHALSIPLSFLRPYYHNILFTYGASHDRSLGASVLNDDSPDLQNVLSARSFVHWYNGHPHSPFHTNASSHKLDLSNLHKATIIGQGNVALDCARILLSGSNEKELKKLSKTDTPEPVLAELAKSSIRDVEIVGRRGPLQFAGTTKEIRELVALQDEAGIDLRMTEEDMRLVKTALREMDDFASRGGKMENARMKKRLLGLMQKATSSSTSSTRASESAASWSLSFCRSPIALLSKDGTGSGPISSIKYELNDLAPISTSTLPSNDLVDPSSYMARGTGQTITTNTDFLLKSVGYRSIGIQGLPFDERKGIVRNIEGRIQDEDGNLMKGMYVSGWLARGPNGVIATTMYDAFQTAETMISDFVKNKAGTDESIADLPDLRDQGFGDQRVVSWQDWKAIDQQERRNGEKLGKEREKFVTVQDMLGVLG